MNDSNIEKVGIHTELIRLDSFLKLTAIVQSGGEAKYLIQEGFVEVNGEVCTQRTKKLFIGDRVTVSGEEFIVSGEDE